MSLPKARTAPDKTAIERQIAATEEQNEWFGTPHIFMSDVKARHDRMVELVETMLKLHG
jgi:hypothetical protein